MVIVSINDAKDRRGAHNRYGLGVRYPHERRRDDANFTVSNSALFRSAGGNTASLQQTHTDNFAFRGPYFSGFEAAECIAQVGRGGNLRRAIRKFHYCTVQYIERRVSVRGEAVGAKS